MVVEGKIGLRTEGAGAIDGRTNGVGGMGRLADS